jgi:hypothetical protein
MSYYVVVRTNTGSVDFLFFGAPLVIDSEKSKILETEESNRIRIVSLNRTPNPINPLNLNHHLINDISKNRMKNKNKDR